jgi:hypothetical protein
VGFAPADCRFFFDLTISPGGFAAELVLCFLVGGAVFFRIVILDVTLVPST